MRVNAAELAVIREGRTTKRKKLVNSQDRPGRKCYYNLGVGTFARLLVSGIPHLHLPYMVFHLPGASSAPEHTEGGFWGATPYLAIAVLAPFWAGGFPTLPFRGSESAQAAESRFAWECSRRQR